MFAIPFRSALPLFFLCFAALACGQDAPPAPPTKIPPVIPGRPAPKIQVKEWLSGEHIVECKKGRVYVFEFFRSRYKPARAYAKTFEDMAGKFRKKAEFAAISIFENDQEDAKAFVKNVAPKVSYSIAIDDNNFMSLNWFVASGMIDLPGIVIVNKDQTVAWVGKASDADVPLGKIADGKWNLKAYIAEQKIKGAKEVAEFEAWNKHPVKLSIDKVNALLQAHDGEGALKEIDTLVTLDAKDSRLNPIKWGVFLRLNAYTDLADLEGFYAACAQVLDVCSDDATMLNNTSWMIVDPKAGIPERHWDMATKLVLKAIEVDKNQSAYWDTLGWAYFGSGNKEKAIEAEKEAIRLADDLDAEDRYKKVLAQFEAKPDETNIH